MHLDSSFQFFLLFANLYALCNDVAGRSGGTLREWHASQSTRMVVAYQKRYAGASHECYQEVRQRNCSTGDCTDCHGDILERYGQLSTFVRIYDIRDMRSSWLDVIFLCVMEDKVN